MGGLNDIYISWYQSVQRYMRIRQKYQVWSFKDHFEIVTGGVGGGEFMAFK